METRQRLEQVLNQVTSSRLFKQSVAAVILVALALLVINVPLGTLEPARRYVRGALQTDYDFAGTVARVRKIEVQEVIADVKTSLSRVRGEEPPVAEVMQPPLVGPIVSEFGWRADESGQQELHEGIDIAATPGTPVTAALGGVVRAVEPGDGNGGTVILEHGDNLATVYGRLTDISVSPGDEVRQGQAVGGVQQNEKSAVSFLHFEVRVDGTAVDPAPKVFPDGGS